MKINYHQRVFRAVSNSDNGAVDTDTLFEYQQQDNILTATYQGIHIRHGQLIGIVDEEGHINMRYQQVNHQGELMTGTCQSTPHILPDGKIRLLESWQWTSGDCSSGQSILEEI